MDCLAIRFPYSATLLPVVRAIPGAVFSKSNKCWYVSTREGLVEEIFTAFKGKAQVDTTALKATQDSAREHLDQKFTLNDQQRQALRMMEQKLHLRGYSSNTSKTYLQGFKDFLLFYPDAHPADLTETEIRNYLLYIVERKRISRSTQISASIPLNFSMKKFLGKSVKSITLKDL